jgi:hypothetical protein
VPKQSFQSDDGSRYRFLVDAPAWTPPQRGVRLPKPLSNYVPVAELIMAAEDADRDLAREIRSTAFAAFAAQLREAIAQAEAVGASIPPEIFSLGLAWELEALR